MALFPLITFILPITSGSKPLISIFPSVSPFTIISGFFADLINISASSFVEFGMYSILLTSTL